MMRWCFHIGLVLMNIGSCHNVGRPTAGPVFRKEGAVYFLRGVDTIKRVDVEFATTDVQRERGLMYRRSMEEGQGMLFIFSREEEQSFWMKNTYIPLDIIFISAEREIVSVKRDARPMSEEGLGSEKPAMYVLEVNGGFCERWRIREGDRIGYVKK